MTNSRDVSVAKGRYVCLGVYFSLSCHVVAKVSCTSEAARRMPNKEVVEVSITALGKLSMCG